MALNKIKVPYTATYRVTFDNGYDRIVNDTGEMTRVLKTQAYSKTYGPFKLGDCPDK